MGQKGDREVDSTAQVRCAATDAERVELSRSSLHRLAPVALSALGIVGALLMIFAGLVALNHTVLPFKGWPVDGGRFDAGKQLLPRAPVETGRLRTAPGGAHAAATQLLRSALPVLAAAPQTAAVTTPGVRLRVRHGGSHAGAPARRNAQQPVAAPPPVAPAPAAPPAPAPAPAQPTPVAAAPVAVAKGPLSRRPSTSSTGATAAPVTTSAPGRSGSAPGHSGSARGNGRAHAPGQLKKAVAIAAPAAAPAAPAPAAPAVAAEAPGNGRGHGPPPWARGQH